MAVVAFDTSDQFVNPQYVALCAVDGSSAKMDANRSIDVLPGRRRVRFLYEGGKAEGVIELTFDAKPGHRYLVTYLKKSFSERQFDDSFAVWVEDTATKEHLKEVEASPLRSIFTC